MYKLLKPWMFLTECNTAEVKGHGTFQHSKISSKFQHAGNKQKWANTIMD